MEKQQNRKCINWFFVILFCFTANIVFAQVPPPPGAGCTINGSSSVPWGTVTTYTLTGSGCSATGWSISCGTVQSFTSTSALIDFNGSYSCTTATISALGTTATKSVTITVPPLVGGTINNPSQFINYNTTPAQITSTAASGGECGSYSYQWYSSLNNSTFSSISGATTPSYQPPALTVTMYYKRNVICGSLNSYTTNTATVTVYPQLVAGTVDESDGPPNYDTVSYNTSPGWIKLFSVSGGSGTYAYQWQSSPNNSTWTKISGATSTTYTIGNLTSTTYYNVAVSSNSDTLNSASFTVVVNPQFFPGTITQSYLTISSGTSPGEITASISSGGGCAGAYTYQWQDSTYGVTFTSISGATTQNYTPVTLTANTWYRRQDNCSIDQKYTNVCQVTVASTSTSLNFTRIRSILKAGVTDTVTADGLTSPYDVAQTSQYFDGLGRLVQTVSKQSSPLQNDAVQSVVYDNFGRQSDQYLPYIATTNDGNYKTTAFADQLGFNTAQFSGEQYYYGETVYEASPLNRSLAGYSPGLSWEGNNTGFSMQYIMNAVSDSVQIWSISSIQFSLPVNGGAYLPNQLYKSLIVDEGGHQMVEYKDKLGKTILKKLQLVGSPSTGHSGWLNTYYVYDTLQNLRVIIQPQAVALINGSWSISQNIANELCFRYEYDGRKCVTIKKVPGAGQVWMVNDARNRLVMSQDSALRSIQKWMFIKYDSENRPDSTGLITDPTNYNNLAYHDTLAYHSINYPTVSSYTNELLTLNFYDDYSWVSAYSAPVSASMATNYTSNSNYFVTSYNTSPTYAVQVTPFLVTRGLSTGSMKKVVGSTSQYLYSSNFYDDRGRVIQAQAVNFTGAIDTITIQYNFEGTLLRTLLNHNKSGNTAQNHIVVTKMDYDQVFRLRHIWKNVDGAASDQLIDSMQYNELGQLNAKYIGNSIDSLVYSYNIRGWLTGINKNYIAGSTNHFFGMEIGYDKTTSVAPGNTYIAPEFNGNIEGIVWKNAGDGINRKYDFAYDDANRLSTAAFLQNTSGTAWDKNYLDFSVSGMSYDANGNILSMTQRGFTVGGSSAVDSLTYSYLNTNASNKLMGVVDAANNPTSLLGDFHYNQTTKQSTDYTYDGNGNLLTDNNKAIDKTTYNYLNLPQLVHMNTKGNISYTYDAGGTKLSKVVTDSTVRHSITTLYICGFVYQQNDTITNPGGGIDTLQFIAHEEGRVRWAYHKYTTGATAYKFEYDFFEKDNLGNTRMVLTQQKDTSNYLASMEAAYRTTESQLFSNITTTCYARASVSGYPDDLTYTNPNDSVSKVDYTGTSGQKTGPSLLLKVMSGDTVKFGVQSYYNTGTGGTNNSSFTDVLNSLANALFSSTGGSHGTLGNLEASNSTIYSGLTNFLSTDDPPPTGFPKAYLNWIFLDDQFNYVSSLSGSVQAASTTYPSATLNTVAPGSQLALTKSGYLYIWVSNETQGWDVFFDNLSIQYKQGPVLEMNNYYPFGLTMQGLSDKAIKTNYGENKYRYNQASEIQNKEFSDGTGLEMYETSFRGLDPQLGRFSQIDPMADETHFFSTYQYAINNPILYCDPSGLLQQSPQTIQTMAYFMYRMNQGGGGGHGDDIDQDFQSIDDLNATIADMQSFYQSVQNAAFFQNVWDGTPDDGVNHLYKPNADGNFTNSTIYYNYINPSGSGIYETAHYHGLNSNQVGDDYRLLGSTLRTISQSFNDLETAGEITDAIGISFETTQESIIGAQKLGNWVGGTTSKILRGGDATELVGKGLTYLGAGLTIADGLSYGWQPHHTADLVIDATIYAISASIPVAGWIVGGAFFLGNMISEYYTGKTLTENAFDH